MRFWKTAVLGGAAFVLVGGKPAEQYAVGQVWEYQARTQDAGSILKIQRIDRAPIGPIYHVSVIGIRFRNQHIAGVVPHTPVSEATLDASVTKQSSADFPSLPFNQGIEQWESAKGGVFTLPVAKIVDIIDDQVSGTP